MRSHITVDFRRCFSALTKAKRKEALADYRLWQADTTHPSLQFKEVVPAHQIGSVRAGMSYRACGKKRDATAIVWFWIGSHGTYDKLLDKWAKANKSDAPKA